MEQTGICWMNLQEMVLIKEKMLMEVVFLIDVDLY